MGGRAICSRSSIQIVKRTGATLNFNNPRRWLSIANMTRLYEGPPLPGYIHSFHQIWVGGVAAPHQNLKQYKILHSNYKIQMH